MTFSVTHKTNIRHFMYYLVNGTLDFGSIENVFAGQYHFILKNRPDLFYKTACVFINQEFKYNPDWPHVKRLGKFICSAYKLDEGLNEMEEWEMDYAVIKRDWTSDFKMFVNWFIETEIVEGVSYGNYIEEGASFNEQCFAIWTNVAQVKDNCIDNSDYAIERVSEYIKSYYIPGFIDNLEQWECELF